MSDSGMSDEETNPLGFHLYANPATTVRWRDRAFSVIGHLHRPEEFLVGEDSSDDSVWIISSDLLGEWPLNASRRALEGCLAAFERYLADGPEDTGPVVYTGEEMRERLERFRRGELAPKPPSKPVVSHRKRLKRLRQDFASADPSALTPESWWSTTLEEAKHDLI